MAYTCKVLLLILGLIFKGNLVSCKGCLTASGGSIPPFYDDKKDPLPASNAVQAIITTYKFNCNCVNITSWETYVQPGGRKHFESMPYNITFQVWRPSPTVENTGCYSLVGENRFENFLFTEHGLVQLTPTPPLNTIIIAQSEDVVGYYTNSRGGLRNGVRENGVNEGIQLENGNSYNQNIIWYHDLGRGPLVTWDNECPYPVGSESDRSLRNYTNAAPMLNISTTEVLCPTLHTLPLPSSPRTTMVITSTQVPTVDTSATSSSSENFLSPLSLSPSSTQDIPASNINKNVGISLIAAIIAVLGFLMAFTLMIVLLVVFLLKRRTTRKVELAASGLDLSNPNYVSSSVEYVLRDFMKEADAKKESKLSKNFSKQVTLTFGNKKEELTCVNLEYENASGHAYAEASSEDIKDSSNTDVSYSNVDSGLHKPHTVYSGTGNTFYHAVGSNDELKTGNASNSPLAAAKKMDGNPANDGGIYHVLEEPLNDSEIDYKYTKKDSSENMMMFESTGYYVPTQEERRNSGPVYEEYSKSLSHYSKLKFFEEDDIYWTPATTTSALYSQLASKKYREIPRSQIRLQNHLGSGQFGVVYKATWSIGKQELELAVKTLKAGSSEEDKVKFLQEAAIMGQFSHINVIKMYGVVTMGEPILICLEVLENGDLRGYLLRQNLIGSNYDDFKEAQMMFLKFARDIAAGMEYLSKKSFVHRDLAARNILLNKSLTCKVADFGMARDLMDDTYYTCSGGQIPVKWTAPEALLFRKYSADSDVWSYGMVLFEIWSVGKKPFSTITNSKVLRLLEKGFCQAPPPGCPRAIYKLMVDCWNPSHQLRPSFSMISQKYLKQPSGRLLDWAPENNSLSPAVGICGAPLEVTEKLYLNLQKKYKGAKLLN